MKDIEVVIFNYKYEHWLPACLDAIAQQTHQSVRVRVSDDASPGEHGAAFRNLAARYPWADFTQNPRNVGPVEHMRLRIGEVRAKYYLLLSADDLIVDHNFLHDAVCELEAHPNAIASYGLYHVVNSSGRIVRAAPSVVPHSITEFAGAEMRDLLALCNVVPAVCTVVRSEVHERIPPFPVDNRLAHDWAQWYLLTLCGDYLRLNRPVLHYRVHDASLSRSIERDIGLRKDTMLLYEQLLAWPGLSQHDLSMLKRGRARNLLRLSRVGDLGATLSNPLILKHLNLRDCIENLAFRVEGAAHRWHQKSREHLADH